MLGCRFSFVSSLVVFCKLNDMAGNFFLLRLLAFIFGIKSSLSPENHSADLRGPRTTRNWLEKLQTGIISVIHTGGVLVRSRPYSLLSLARKMYAKCFERYSSLIVPTIQEFLVRSQDQSIYVNHVNLPYRLINTYISKYSHKFAKEIIDLYKYQFSLLNYLYFVINNVFNLQLLSLLH